MSNIAQQEIATSDKEQHSRAVRPQLIKFGTTKWLTYAAVFSAIAIICKIISRFMMFGPFMITLVYIPWLMSGAVLGIVGGGMVCFTSDVLISAAFPIGGAIDPLTTLSNTIFGILGALIFRIIPSKHYSIRFIVAGIVCILVCTCTLGSLARWIGDGEYKTLDFFVYAIFKRWPQPIVAGLNVAATATLSPLLIKTKLLRNLKTIPPGKEKQRA